MCAGRSRPEVEWLRHPALEQGDFNRLSVAVRNGLVTVWFNGRWAGDVRDPDYEPGFLRLAATAGPTRAEFRDLRVWELPP